MYNHYNSSDYWKKRASEPSQAAVLWKNQEYNALYRKDQNEILRRYMQSLPDNSCLLDIGCGIGVVSSMITRLNPSLQIDAVDFQEMITIAASENAQPQINYIACEAENYLTAEGKYALILSSGCYSAIRDISLLEQSLAHAATMLKPDGLIVMIDPFHRWNYLARAKYNSHDVEQYLAAKNLVLEKRSGLLFWPFREWLANSAYTGEPLQRRYEWGERLLALLGRHFWADYKILVFRKR